MNELQARIRRFITDRPDSNATAREIRDNFGSGATEAISALATDGYVVMSKAGSVVNLTHAIVDGRPVVGVRL